MLSIPNATINIVQTRPTHQQHPDRIHHHTDKNMRGLLVELGRFARRLISQIRRGWFMQSTPNATINIVQTRPTHSQHSDRIDQHIDKNMHGLLVGLSRFIQRLISTDP